MRDIGTPLDQVPGLAQSTEGLGKDASSDTWQLVIRSPILSVPSFKSITFLLLLTEVGLLLLLRIFSSQIDVCAPSYNVVCTGITSNNELQFIPTTVVNDFP